MQSIRDIKKVTAIFITALALLVGLCATAGAQTAGTGSIIGTIKDPQGGVIPGAEVVVKNVDTGAERRSTTGESGLYSAPYLQPGRYELRVKKEGFAEVIRQNIRLEVGQTIGLDIDMPLKAAQETVTVTGEAGAVETEKVEVSQTINQEAVENLPLNGRRWDNLVLLTPGVSEDGGFGGVSFRGISSLYNNNMVDGADNNQAFFSEARGRTRLPYVYSINSIKEFNVTNAAYSAEQGRAAGGTVNAVTKSGTNEMHGDFFYFIRDDIWLARDPIANASGQPKPEERRQQFGGALGGPIIPDKLFYFVSYDQQKRNFPSVNLANDALFFSTTSSGSQAFNCVTAVGTIGGVAIPAGFATECNNVLASVAPIFNTIGPRKGDNFVGLAKIDYQWDQNNRISGVTNIQRWDSPSGIFTGPVLRGTSPLANGSDRVKSEFLTVTWSYVVTPTIVNEASFQYGRDFETQTPNASGPQFQIAGGSNFGMPNFLPRGAFPDEKQFQWRDNVGWQWGRHQVKAGMDIRHVRDRIQNLFNGGGIYSYTGSNALRNFVFDLVNSTTMTPTRNYNQFTQAVDPITIDGLGEFSTNDYNFYVQDNWKLRPNLTLNLGLRYELQDTPGIVQANPLVPETNTLNTDTNNFGPRFGLAWSPGGSGKEVLRGGAGIYFGRTQNSSLFVHLFQNGIFQRTFTFTSTSCGAPIVPNTVFPQPSTAPAFGPIFGSGGPTPVPTFADLAAFQAACPAVGGTAPVVQTLDPTWVSPVVYQYDVAYERELPWRLSFSVTYVGSRGLHLPVFYDANLPLPNQVRTYQITDGSGRLNQSMPSVTVPFFVVTGAGSVPRPRAAQGVTGPLSMGRSIVNSWYNGLVIRVKRRVSRGLTFDANYTWSKARDNGQVAGVNGTFTGSVSPLNPHNLLDEYGTSEIDIRRRLTAHVVWVMPWGDWVESRELKAVVKDWRLSSVWRIQDGRPVTANMSGRPTCTTGLGGLTCGAATGGGGAVNGRVPFIVRNTQFTTPGLVTFDLRLSREFKVSERAEFELIWEAFNIFNRTNFVPSSGIFAVEDRLYDLVGNNGTIISAGTGGNPPAVTCTNLLGASVPATQFNGCLVLREPPRQAAADSFLAPRSTGNTLFTARQMQFGAKVRF